METLALLPASIKVIGKLVEVTVKIVHFNTQSASLVLSSWKAHPPYTYNCQLLFAREVVNNKDFPINQGMFLIDFFQISFYFLMAIWSFSSHPMLAVGCTILAACKTGFWTCCCPNRKFNILKSVQINHWWSQYFNFPAQHWCLCSSPSGWQSGLRDGSIAVNSME